MVRNAVRIINLTVYKINDAKLNNDILADVPFCLNFVNIACLLRDKVCKGIDKSFYCQNYIQGLNSSKSGGLHGSEIGSNPYAPHS